MAAVHVFLLESSGTRRKLDPTANFPTPPYPGQKTGTLAPYPGQKTGSLPPYPGQKTGSLPPYPGHWIGTNTLTSSLDRN